MDENQPLDLSMKNQLKSFVKNNAKSTKNVTEWIEKFSILLKYPKCFQYLTKEKMLKLQNYRNILFCDTCHKFFDRPSLLQRHIRSHTGVRPYKCDSCDKAFSTSSSLNTHKRIHTGEKPFRCSFKGCGKQFTASSNLYYHRMIHFQEKPHKCSLCTRTFPTPGDLRNHFYVHSGLWPYVCKCGRGFAKKAAYQGHLTRQGH